MMRRNFWKKNEIKCMLDVFKDLNVVQLLEQKTLPINDIYGRVQHEMTRRGFRLKNSKQIQSKWSQMKSAYMCLKRNHKLDYYKEKDIEFRDDVADLVENNIEGEIPISGMPMITETDCPDEPLMESAAEEDNQMDSESEAEPKYEADKEVLDAICEEFDDEPDEEKIFIPKRRSAPSKKKEESATTKQGSYKKSFERFVQQLKVLERDLQDEFVMRQKRLMAQEHKLQVERDNMIIASLAANTNQILKQTQELIEKGFER